MSTGLRFTLEVDGLPPDAFAVVSFHLNQSLSSLFSLDLSLVSQQFLSLEFAQVLDKMAYLTIWQGDEVQRRGKGVGKQLYQRFLQYLKKEHLDSFYLYTDTSCNYGFYEHQGMVRRCEKEHIFTVNQQRSKMTFFIYDCEI